MKQSFGWGITWFHAVMILSAFLSLAFPDLARAAKSDHDTSAQGGFYAGVFAGRSQIANQIIDINGFANWGQNGWTVDYDNTGSIGGILIGKKHDLGSILLRTEMDIASGGISAASNRLDPYGLDETAKAEFRSIMTARMGLERSFGPVTFFVSGGLAVARIENSVTDIDFGPNMTTRIDPDDSFRSSSMQSGWVASLGVEAPLSDAWTLRLEGLQMDFGQDTHYVNRSGNNRCGPGLPRRSCPYKTENRAGIFRLAIIYRFGG